MQHFTSCSGGFGSHQTGWKGGMSALRSQGFFAVGRHESVAYLMCFTLVFLGYHMCSDGKFSAIICLGSVFQALAFVLLFLQLQKHRNTAGISMKMLQMYIVVYVLRLYSNLRFEDYLPVDRSGDWAYQLADCFSLALVATLLWTVRTRRRMFHQDVIQEHFPVGIVVGGCLVAAFFVHPGRIQDLSGDMCWAAAQYVESFVMIPQLMLVTGVTGQDVEGFTAHMLASVFSAKLCTLAFQWRYFAAFKSTGGGAYSAYAVFGTQVLQVVMLADFAYYYLRNLVRRSALFFDTYLV